MDYEYLGELVPVAALFIMLLACIVGAIVWTATRYHASGMAGTVGHDYRFPRRQERTKADRASR
jgi:hypothetical protein